MDASQNCYDIIKSSEGCFLSAYKDPGTKNTTGLPITIGWGSTIKQDGSRFNLGDTITQQQADDLLAWAVNKTAQAIQLLLPALNQNQFDAIVSFVYNIGLGQFKNSTLYKKAKVNPNDSTISKEFAKWNLANGIVLKGLMIRRAKEAALYLT